MKKRDNVSEIFNDIMSNENYIDSLVSNIKVFRTSISLYLASMERDASHAFEDTIKLRAIRDESQAIIKSIESF